MLVNELEPAAGNASASTQAMSIEELTERADAGDIAACLKLADLYRDGNAMVKPDRVRRYRYLNKAAELGSKEALYYLASMQKESGDHAAAFENARLAAEAGVAAAQTLLGKMLLEGLGTKKSVLEGMDWLSRAADAGHPEAILFLAHEHLTGERIERDRAKAYALAKSQLDDWMVNEDADVDFSDPKPGVDYGLAYFIMGVAAYYSSKDIPGCLAWDNLMREGVRYGNSDAQVFLNEAEQRAKSAEIDKKWNEISRFTAHGKTWEMFFKTGRLVQVADKRFSTTNSIGNNVYTNTSTWKEAAFNVGEDAPAIIKFENREGKELISNSMYRILYCGIEGSGSGVPLAVVRVDGNGPQPILYSTGSLSGAYKKQASFSVWGSFGMVVVAIILSVIMFNVSFILGIGCAAACAWFIKSGFKQKKTEKEAIRKALEFLQRERF